MSNYIVEYFKQLINEENGIVEDVITERKGNIDHVPFERIGMAVPSEVGKGINGVLAKVLLDQRNNDKVEKNFFDADLKVNITSGALIAQYIPEFTQKIETLGLKEESFMYVAWRSESDITLDDTIFFLNRIASDVLPKKLTKDMFFDLGEADMLKKKQGDEDETEPYHFYIVKFTSAELGIKEPKKSEDSKNLKKMFSQYQDIKKKYTEQGLVVKIGDKTQFANIFAKNKALLSKFDDNQMYMVILFIKNQIGKVGMLKIFNAIIKDCGYAEVTEDKLEKIGNIKAKHRSSGIDIDMDVYAVKL